MCNSCNAPEHRDITEEQRKAICAAETAKAKQARKASARAAR